MAGMTVSRRTLLRGMATGVGLALAEGPAIWQQSGSVSELPDGLHLVFGQDPRREMTVSWSTRERVANPRVWLGEDETFGSIVAAESRSLVNGPGLYHHARLKDLEPGTTYTYRVGHDGAEGGALTFTTAPARPTSFRFTAFGDHGLESFTAPTVKRIMELQPAFHFHVGDLSYASGTGGVRALEVANELTGVRYDLSAWDRWLTAIQPVASTVPWMPVVGNHEMEVDGTELGYDGWKTRFTLPSNGVKHEVPTTYWFRYGNVACIALDGNDVSYELPRNYEFLGGAQEIWLRNLLAQLREDRTIDWIVAGFHHCAYCSSYRHGSDGGVRDRWTPLFDEFQVDLVINGHNHMYERTHPVRNGTVDFALPHGDQAFPADQGTIYLTAGLGDDEDVIPDRSTEPLSPLTLYTGQDLGARIFETAPWSAVHKEAAAVVVSADVQPPDRPGGITTMRISSAGPDGVEVDRFTLVRTSKPAGSGSLRTNLETEGAAQATGLAGQLPVPGGFRTPA